MSNLILNLSRRKSGQASVFASILIVVVLSVAILNFAGESPSGQQIRTSAVTGFQAGGGNPLTPEQICKLDNNRKWFEPYSDERYDPPIKQAAKCEYEWWEPCSKYTLDQCYNKDICSSKGG